MAVLPPQARMLVSAYNKATSGKTASFTAVKPSFMLYLGLALVALLKDLLDLVGVGSLPGIGTVITLCFSFLIWILMTMFDKSGGKQNNQIARSLVLLFLSLLEAIGFGLNFLPIETLTVIALYVMAKSAAKKEQKRLWEEQKKDNANRQAEAYRFQAQMAQQAMLAEEAAEAVNDAQYSNTPAEKVA